MTICFHNGLKMMNIAFGSEHDGVHDIGECGYEWWYYDCVSEDSEYSVVLIFFRDIPMLPKCINERSTSIQKRHNSFDGLSINVYHKKKKIAQKLIWSTRHHTCFDEESETVSFLGNTVSHHLNTYAINVDIDTGNDSRRIVFYANLLNENSYVNVGERINPAVHTWLAIAPVMFGECHLEIWDGGARKIQTTFSAHAYHDHNVGALPVFREFHSWYWGKVVCDYCTFVYYYVPAKNEQQLLQWACIFEKKSNNCMILRDVVVQEYTMSLTYTGLRYCKKMVVTGFTNNNDAVELTVLQNYTVENGPFYIRFASIATLKINSTVFTDTHAIGEYFHAKRLTSKIVQTFISLPWTEV